MSYDEWRRRVAVAFGVSPESLRAEPTKRPDLMDYYGPELDHLGGRAQARHRRPRRPRWGAGAMTALGRFGAGWVAGPSSRRRTGARNTPGPSETGTCVARVARRS